MHRSILVALTALMPLAAGAVDRQEIRGTRPPVARRLQPLDRLSPTNRLHLAIGLPWRHPEALTNLLRELGDPNSPNYRRYLTAEEFTERFGPAEEAYTKVKAFASGQGLRLRATHPNRLMLEVEGDTATVERTFGVTLRVYRDPSGTRAFYAPDTEPSCALDVPIRHISGLDNYRVPEPRLRRSPTPNTPAATPRRGTGSGGTYLGNDFRKAYAPGVTLDGAGQTVGMFQLDGFYASDIAAYVKLAGISNVPVRTVLIDGFSGTPTTGTSGGNEEVSLDIEMVMSMAPGLSEIIVYEGSPTGSGAVLNHILNRMATDNAARQLSCSWGFDIDAISQQIFQQYAAQGQSFFLASGDDGAFAEVVHQPSDSPYITVVGGTTLNTDSQQRWTSETVWSGSGGGISGIYPLPEWQSGFDWSAAAGSTLMRNTPDVAMVATNVWVIAGKGQGFAAAGTSIAAPLWAAYTALVNQQAELNGQPPVGFVNPALYRIGASATFTNAFHDVVSGNTTNADSPKRYFAVPGYDLCTGWGAPNGSNFIQALLAVPQPVLSIQPPLGFTANGAVGGPFNVTGQTYALTNTSDASLEWSLVNTAAWLTASPSRGTLAPGAAATEVSIRLNATATNLLIGDYSAWVTFTNHSRGTSQQLRFDLQSGNGGFELGDFSRWTFSGSSAVNYAHSVDYSIFTGEDPLPGVGDSAFVHSGIYGALLGQANRLGGLYQTVPTQAGQDYLLSFWLANPAAGTPNQFRVTWGSTVVYNETNLGAFDWTNYQFLVTASAASTRLRFDFRNDRMAFALDDIRLEPAPATTRVLALSGDLSFGEVAAGAQAQAALLLANQGNDALSVGSIAFPDGFSGDWFGAIAPGTTQAVTVTFAPTRAGAYEGVATVVSDRTSGVNVWPVSGAGIALAANIVWEEDTLQQVYDGSPKTAAATVDPAGLDYSITYDGSMEAPTAVGAYQLVALVSAPAYAGSNTASMTITPAKLTVTAQAASRFFGATNPTFTADITGLVGGDTMTAVAGEASFTTPAASDSPPGTYPIVPALGNLSATNYSFDTFNEGVLTIRPAPLTVAALDARRAYGVTNPVFRAQIAGFVGNDSIAVVTGEASFTTPATLDSPPGTYPIVPELGTLGAANYTFDAFNEGTLTVFSNTTRIEAPSFVNGTFQISLQSQPGLHYTLQFKEALTDAEWQPVQSGSGTGEPLVLTDRPGASSSRYYRVRVE